MSEEVKPSKAPLILAMVILTVPALIPLYFATQAEEQQVLVFLIILAIVVMVSNTAIVFALWRWVTANRDR